MPLTFARQDLFRQQFLPPEPQPMNTWSSSSEHVYNVLRGFPRHQWKRSPARRMSVKSSKATATARRLAPAALAYPTDGHCRCSGESRTSSQYEVSGILHAPEHHSSTFLLHEVALELGCMRALGMLNACRRDGLAAHSKTKSGNASLTQIILEDAVCSPIKP